MNRRQELLHEQMQITENHCNNCPFGALQTDDHCKSCEHYYRLRKIGNDLLKETKEKRVSKGVKSVSSYGRGLPPKAECTLTVAQYRGLKSKGMKDKEVAEKNGCSLRQLLKWKHKNNLVRR